MKVLSSEATLSDTYTNHSIRKTCLQTLDDNDFEACHVMWLSSHKSESTINEYATKCPESEKKNETLTDTILPKPHQPTATVSVPP